MTLGQKINTLRSEKELTQKALAAQLGVTTGTIAEWEADEATPNLSELSRLSKALNVSSDILIETATEDIAVPVAAPKQEPVPVIAPAKKRKKKGLVIGAVALCVALIVAAAVLWSQGVFTTESLLFSEDTAKIEAADASVVTIFCYDYEGELAATGSGFVAFDGKTIITNYHVMTSAYTCKISTNQDISYEVSKILCYSEERDIAILQISKDTGLQPLALGDSSVVKKGETVVAIGSPLGIKNTVSTGVLSGRLMEENMDVLQFTAPISSGSSGGALFDDGGKVIGITYASIQNGQNLNLAIPINEAIELYNTTNTLQAQNVNSIFFEKNPSYVYLDVYDNLDKVSISELKDNPQKYNGKRIVLKAYVSSFKENMSTFLAEKEHITGDYIDDALLYSLRNFEETSLIEIVDGYECIDRPKSIAIGDELYIIGIFRYEPIGDGYRIDKDLGFSVPVTRNFSFAELRANYIILHD